MNEGTIYLDLSDKDILDKFNKAFRNELSKKLVYDEFDLTKFINKFKGDDDNV